MPPSILMFLIVSDIPQGCLDNTAWSLAATCKQFRVPQADAEAILRELYLLMDQPWRDDFSLEFVLSKVSQVYNGQCGSSMHSRKRRSIEAVTRPLDTCPIDQHEDHPGAFS